MDARFLIPIGARVRVYELCWPATRRGTLWQAPLWSARFLSVQPGERVAESSLKLAVRREGTGRCRAHEQVISARNLLRVQTKDLT